MTRYYTRPCNFYYGTQSKTLVNQKKSIPLNQIKEISFDKIEIISRNSKKKISINKIKFLPKKIRAKIILDIKNIKTKKKNFSNLNFNKIPNILGVLNLTPDSFSDGGKFNSKNKGIKHAIDLFNNGADLIDVGGESTRPGSKSISINQEWSRISNVIKILARKIPLSLDTRKSSIMKDGIELGVKLINDISGLSFDSNTLKILKRYKIPFVIQHSKGTPENMQNRPSYKNELLEIYDFFEDKIKLIRSNGINHNNIILDPGIGFGKTFDHNLTIINNLKDLCNLGHPIMVGTSRKAFIGDILDTPPNERLEGTIASVVASVINGANIVRVHDVKEIKKTIMVTEKILGS